MPRHLIDNEKFIELHGQGKSDKEIAAALGLGYSAISKHRRDLGLRSNRPRKGTAPSQAGDVLPPALRRAETKSKRIEENLSLVPSEFPAEAPPSPPAAKARVVMFEIYGEAAILSAIDAVKAALEG